MIQPSVSGSRHRRAAATAVGLTLMLVAAACRPAVPTATLTQLVTSTWSTGQEATLTITNDSAATMAGWELTVDLSAQVTSVWDADMVSQVGDVVTMTSPNWAPDLAPGASARLGYIASTDGTLAVPRNCRINGAPCKVVATGTTTSAPSTTTTSSPGTTTSLIGTTTTGPSTTSAPPPTTTSSAPTSTTTTATTTTATTTTTTTTTATSTPPTTPPAGPGAEIRFAPYIDVTLWPPPDLAGVASESGVDTFTLAFIVAGATACQPAWGGVIPLADEYLAPGIADLRATGGDVVISFGGANGTELAQSCSSATTLAAAYQSVIDTYDADHVDFDIEGGAVVDPVSVERRSQAFAILQADAAAAGRDLDITVTLPALPSGLTAAGTGVVSSAISHGVDLTAVNIMAMDYGDGPAPGPEGQMGTYAIQAAQSLKAQLATLLPGATNSELWSMVAITPMIGQNDVSTERFYPADAQQLVDWARVTGIGRLAMWSVTRDQPCPGGPSEWASATCSGITTPPWTFSQILSQIA